QQRPAGGAALAPLEVAVRRRGADLASLEPVGIHSETHRAAGAAPFEAGLPEHLVEAPRLGGPADRLRPRYHERRDVLGDAVTAYEARGFLEVRQPSVRAGADERHIDLRTGHAP